jgi:hypothetical protein
MGDGQTQETALQKITAVAAGVVAGVALLAAIIGLSSTSSSMLANAFGPAQETVSRSALAVAPQARLRSPHAQHAQPPLVQGKSRIAIQAKQGSWIDACADGRTVMRRYLPPANTAELGFSKVAVVRTGNAGGIEMSFNGVPTGTLGKLGEVRVMRFDGSGFHLLEPSDPGAECGQ